MTFTQALWNLSIVFLLVAVVLLILSVIRGNIPSATELAIVAIGLLLASKGV